MSVKKLRVKVGTLREQLPGEVLANARQDLEQSAALLRRATIGSTNEAATEALRQLSAALDHIDRAQHYTAGTDEKLVSYVTGL